MAQGPPDKPDHLGAGTIVVDALDGAIEALKKQLVRMRKRRANVKDKLKKSAKKFREQAKKAKLKEQAKKERHR